MEGVIRLNGRAERAKLRNGQLHRPIPREVRNLIDENNHLTASQKLILVSAVYFLETVCLQNGGACPLFFITFLGLIVLFLNLLER